MAWDAETAGLLLQIRNLGRRKDWQRILQVLGALGKRLQSIHVSVAMTELEKCGAWQLALSLLGHTQTDQITFNTAISICMRLAMWQQALTTLALMGSRHVQSDVVSCSAAIKACESASQWRAVLDILADMPARTIAPNVVTYSTAISACGKAALWTRALALLSEMHRTRPNLISWNSAVSSCANAMEWRRALELLMASSASIQPDTITYNACAAACQKAVCWKLATGLVGEMRRAAAVPSTVTYNSCIACSSWARQVALRDAIGHAGLQISGATLVAMSFRSWRSGLKALSARQLDAQCAGAAARTLAVSGAWVRALLAGIENQFMRNGAIASCQRSNQWATALCLLYQRSFVADVVSYNSAISDTFTWAAVCHMVASLCSRGLQPSLISQNSVLSACGKGGQWSLALLRLAMLTTPSTVSCNAAISACEERGFWDQALASLTALPRAEVQADIVGFSAAVSACEKAGRWKCALGVLKSLGALVANLVFCNAVTSACESAGKWPHAFWNVQSLRSQSLQTDVLSYSGAISAAEKAGKWELPVLILAGLESAQLQVDDMCFGAAISACQRAERDRWG
ncbi:unnamed protein product [Effrenium voratum]|nr:unnamed protein product [Effrenium voratum]